jgi:hypothetical protein
MNLKVEHGIIAILLIAFLYYFYIHQSLLSDIMRIPSEGNAELKAVINKHTSGSGIGCQKCCENMGNKISNQQYNTPEYIRDCVKDCQERPGIPYYRVCL